MPSRSSGTKAMATPAFRICMGVFPTRLAGGLPVGGVENFPLADQAEAGNGLQQLLLAGPGDAGHAQDFAAQGGEGHVVQLFHALAVQDGEALDLQPFHGCFVPGAVDVQGDRVAHHHVRKGLGARLAGFHGSDVLALPEDGDLVGEGHDLVELVGDDDDGFPVGLHGPEHLEELIRLLGGEDGGGSSKIRMSAPR